MKRIALPFILLSAIACGSSTAPTATLFVLPTIPPTFARPITPTFEVPPTFTPVVTHTATAAEAVITPVPTSDDAQLQYANRRDDTAWYLRTVKADIDTTFGQYIEGKVSQYDPTWQALLELYFGEFDVGVEEIAAMRPPAIFEESHELTLSGILACSRGFYQLYDGARLQDDAIYQDGVADIATCNHNWDAGDYAFWDAVLAHSLEWPAMSSPTVAP